MARRYETFLLVMVVALGCRRFSPPPPPPAPPASPPPIAVEPLPPPPSSSGDIEAKAPSANDEAKYATKDHASKDRASKDKEAQPSKTAAGPLQPKRKLRGVHAHASKTVEATEGKVVAAREEVAAAPEAALEAPSRATLRFKNEAGNNYKLVEARFVMDGAELPTVLTSAQRGEAQQIFSGPLPAGHHVLASRLTYQGADRAIFTYMKGYTFHVKSDDEFVARSKNSINMTIVCKEKTGLNDPVERRLFVTVE
jgi:hypothetical protein